MIAATASSGVAQPAKTRNAEYAAQPLHGSDLQPEESEFLVSILGGVHRGGPGRASRARAGARQDNCCGVSGGLARDGETCCVARHCRHRRAYFGSVPVGCRDTVCIPIHRSGTTVSLAGGNFWVERRGTRRIHFSATSKLGRPANIRMLRENGIRTGSFRCSSAPRAQAERC